MAKYAGRQSPEPPLQHCWGGTNLSPSPRASLQPVGQNGAPPNPTQCICEGGSTPNHCTLMGLKDPPPTSIQHTAALSNTRVHTRVTNTFARRSRVCMQVCTARGQCIRTHTARVHAGVARRGLVRARVHRRCAQRRPAGCTHVCAHTPVHRDYLCANTRAWVSVMGLLFGGTIHKDGALRGTPQPRSHRL